MPLSSKRGMVLNVVSCNPRSHVESQWLLCPLSSENKFTDDGGGVALSFPIISFPLSLFVHLPSSLSSCQWICPLYSSIWTYFLSPALRDEGLAFPAVSIAVGRIPHSDADWSFIKSTASELRS